MSSTDFNLNLVAVLVAIQLGVSTFFWSRALNHQLSGPVLIMIVGVVYFVGGGVWSLYAAYCGQKIMISPTGVGFGLLTAAIYFSALIGFSYIFRAEGPALARVTAISSAYPVVTAILVVAVSRKMLNVKEALCILGIVIFVVGLSLAGKH